MYYLTIKVFVRTFPKFKKTGNKIKPMYFAYAAVVVLQTNIIIISFKQM